MNNLIISKKKTIFKEKQEKKSSNIYNANSNISSIFRNMGGSCKLKCDR